MGNYSVENHVVIYNDGSGEKIIVRPDRDALDLVELIHEETKANFVMTTEQAILVAKALIKVAAEIQNDVDGRK